MKNLSIYLLIISFCTLSACNRNKIIRTDTATSGDASIASDECFAPIIKEEIDVFTGLNTEAHINPIYTSETEAFKLLMDDSIRLIIAARDITDIEKKHLKSLKRLPRSQKIAIDGIALIINRENTDSLMSISTLQKIMTGEITDWKDISINNKISSPITVVFDNQNSSTVRFIRDSICKDLPLSQNLTTAKSNPAVINYVANTRNAIGIIGVNWISNPTDSTKLSFDQKIRVVSMSRSNTPTPDNSYKPFPAYLATGDYPLVRNVYAIISDVRGGLPAGFVTFIAGDSGQRIILKAGLVPATRPTRLINIKNEF